MDGRGYSDYGAPADRFGGLGNTRPVFDGGIPPQVKRLGTIVIGAVIGLVVIYALVSGMGRGDSSLQVELADANRRLRESETKLSEALKAKSSSVDCPTSSSSSSVSSSAAVEKRLKKLSSEKKDLEKKVDALRARVAELEPLALAAAGDLTTPTSTAAAATTATTTTCMPCDVQVKVVSDERDVLLARVKMLEAKSFKDVNETTASSTTTTTKAVASARPGVEDELLACVKKTQALGEEMRVLEKKIEQGVAIEAELAKLKREISAQSNTLVKDAVKLVDASEASKNAAVKKAVTDVKDDLVVRSVELELAAKHVGEAKSKIVQQVDDARDTAVKIVKDMATPLKSAAEEQSKLEVERAKASVELTSVSVAAAASETPSPIANVDISAVKVDLLSDNKIKAVEAVAKLEEAADKVQRAGEAVAEQQKQVDAQKAFVALREASAAQVNQVSQIVSGGDSTTSGKKDETTVAQTSSSSEVVRLTPAAIPSQ